MKLESAVRVLQLRSNSCAGAQCGTGHDVWNCSCARDAHRNRGVKPELASVVIIRSGSQAQPAGAWLAP